jgi:hypothetical protein
VILEKEISPEQVALCMVTLKVAREVFSPKRDNLVDAIGYLLAYDACGKEDNEETIRVNSGNSFNAVADLNS